VIKQELAQRVGVAERRRRSASLREPEPEIALNELCERADVTPELVRQLEEFGLLSPRLDGGERWYRESEADIAAASAQLSRYGIDARHLRAFRTAAGRQSALLEQLVAPALRSRNPDRRKDALDDLDQLSTISQALAQLLFLRDLRELIDR
jgi:DNA-binding transcriptional MerR regulator